MTKEQLIRRLEEMKEEKYVIMGDYSLVSEDGYVGDFNNNRNEEIISIWGRCDKRGLEETYELCYKIKCELIDEAIKIIKTEKVLPEIFIGNDYIY